MHRIAIALSLLGIAAFFVSLEILIRPESISPANHITEEKEIEGETPPLKKKAEKMKPQSYFNTKALAEKGISLEKGQQNHALFRQASVGPADPFLIITFPFTEKGEAIGTVSRILATKEMSSGRLMALTRDKLQKSISKKSEIHLSSPQKQIGEANFYLNETENFPDTVFLIVRQGKKVLAFRYPKSYHDQAKNNIPLFFE